MSDQVRHASLTIDTGGPSTATACGPGPEPTNPRLVNLQEEWVYNHCVACGSRIEPEITRGRLCRGCAEKDRREQAERRAAAKAAKGGATP